MEKIYSEVFPLVIGVIVIWHQLSKGKDMWSRLCFSISRSNSQLFLLRKQAKKNRSGGS